ncbi:MAG TPA: ATP-binding protein [Phycisphaerales bacterium]|nr:ATP-binding protein [Phycisphaerales bacterium]
MTPPVLGYAVVLIGVLPLLVWRLHRWSNGLKTLHSGMRRLSQGTPLKPMAVGGEDEIAYLLLGFNEMASRLMSSKAALIDANAHLEHKVEERTQALNTANQSLAQKNVELAQVTETALRFTDDVAHEFRTPLTVVMEFAEIIAEGLSGPVSEKQAEHLQVIIGATGDLATLVDDFLDSGKLRARTLRVDRRSHTVDEILDSAWPILETRSLGRRLTLLRKVESDLPTVFADIEKVRRTLVNLVVNAIKFSPQDSTVVIDAHSGPHGGVELSVIDQGPGMTHEEVSKLFARFDQGHQGKQADSKGFGLGLNIVRQLVALNLGTVSVKSEVKKGSVFSFTLPPDDSMEVLRWFLQRAEERECDTVSALRVSLGDSSEREDMMRVLSSSLYSQDLQLCNPADGTLLLVGESSKPDRWRERLIHLIQDHARPAASEMSVPQIELVGTWTVASAGDPLQSILASSELLETQCHV